MKVSFFLLKFPLSSETFVLNQITAFIDMGHEVEIVALQKAIPNILTPHGRSMAWRRKPAGYRMSPRDGWRNCATGHVKRCRGCIGRPHGKRSILPAMAMNHAI